MYGLDSDHPVRDDSPSKVVCFLREWRNWEIYPLKVERESCDQLSLMATLQWTVHVLDISPKVSFSDLNVFFSYCGTVDDIQLFRKKDHSQLAFVTFKQPYAYQTALLLNGAVIGDSPVRIVALQSLAIHPISHKRNCHIQNKEKQVQDCSMQAIVSKGMEMINKTGDEFSEKGRAVAEQSRMTVCAAEQRAAQLGTAIMNNHYVSNGTTWLSGLLGRASRFASELGNNNTQGIAPVPGSRNG